MKKLLVLVFAAMISVIGINPTSVFAASSEVHMGKYSETVTTSRITESSTGTLKVHIGNYSNNKVSGYIFKNGVLYKSITGIGWTNKYQNYSVGKGEYSLRLYCGTRSNPTTGCVSYGEISN